MNNRPIFKDHNCIKQLTPGIQREEEKRRFLNLTPHQSELKDEELFFRAMNK